CRDGPSPHGRPLRRSPAKPRPKPWKGTKEPRASSPGVGSSAAARAELFRLLDSAFNSASRAQWPRPLRWRRPAHVPVAPADRALADPGVDRGDAAFAAAESVLRMTENLEGSVRSRGTTAPGTRA